MSKTPAPLLTTADQADFVKLIITNSKNDGAEFEMKILKSLTILQLKNKLEMITGGNSATMKLLLYKGGQEMMNLRNDTDLIGALPIATGMRIHVVDNFMWIADDNVEKFELSRDQYECKKDTVRNFLKQNHLGKYDDEEALQQKTKQQKIEHERLELHKAELLPIGARCRVTITGNANRSGTIMYKGLIEGKNGIFIGVKYDEALGKNNGSINGISYFTCEPNHGGFVSPFAVAVGGGDSSSELFDLDDEI